jgi:hypothetical protein
VAIAHALEKSPIEAIGILTYDYYLAVALQRYTRFRPVMIWSPATAAMFDRKLSVLEVRHHLISENIGGIAVGYHSAYNLFLAHNSFYSQDMPHWVPVATVPKSETVFLFPEVAAGAPQPPGHR